MNKETAFITRISGLGWLGFLRCLSKMDEDDAFGITVFLAMAPFEPLDEGVGRRLDVVLGAEREVAPARRMRRDPGAAAAERQRREEHAAHVRTVLCSNAHVRAVQLRTRGVRERPWIAFGNDLSVLL